MKEWIMNEWMNEVVNEWMKERKNEWMYEWMIDWRKEWMNEIVNEWMNEWKKERMKERMNEWMNECAPFLKISLSVLSRIFDSFSAAWGFPGILWNPQVYYCLHKSS